jgi:hypothetical protein
MSAAINSNSAEINFREAFERLKKNTPIRLPKGTPVTQNNVAREAGRDPSGLRKSRYPFLVQDIQEYLQAMEEATTKKKRIRDNRKRTYKEKIADQSLQINKLCSIVDSQNKYIGELMSEIERLKLNVVKPMRNKI